MAEIVSWIHERGAGDAVALDLTGSFRVAGRWECVALHDQAHEGSHMVARIATYSFTGDGQDLGTRAEAGILPILKAQPGFKSYAVAIGEGKVFSSSAWESKDEAESGSAAVASWVADNMTEISLEGDVHYADVAFSTALGVSTA